MMDNALPEDLVTFGSWLAHVKLPFHPYRKAQLLGEGSQSMD